MFYTCSSLVCLHFDSLTPHSYLGVTKRNGFSSSIYRLLVPAHVTDLHVTNQGMTSSLFTNWTKALGDVEFYQVLLIHENVVIKNESVSSETSRYSFHALKPGSLYSVVVTTVSGGISSRQVVAEGRTGKKCRFVSAASGYVSTWSRLPF